MNFSNVFDCEPAYSPHSKRKLILRSTSETNSDPMKALVLYKGSHTKPASKLHARRLTSAKTSHSIDDNVSVLSSSIGSTSGFNFRKSLSSVLGSSSTCIRNSDCDSRVSFLTSSFSTLSASTAQQSKWGKRCASDIDLEHLTKKLKVESSEISPNNSNHPFHLFVSCFLPLVLILLYVLWPSPPSTDVPKIDIGKLNESLRVELFGQPFAQNLVATTLQKFLDDPVTLSLVFIFAGSSGTGKTFTTSLIAQFLPATSLSTYYLHSNIQLLDFKPTLGCGVHMLVFEDMELGSGAQLEYIFKEIGLRSGNCSKVVGIFNTKAGQREIAHLTGKLIKTNVSREAFPLDEFRIALSHVLRKLNVNFESVVVPFLPLEEVHVMKCIRRELETLNKTANLLEFSNVILKVLDQVKFYAVEDVWFAATGCKRLREFLEFHLSQKEVRIHGL